MNASAQATHQCVLTTFSEALQTLGPRHLAKRVAALAETSHRTAERWVSGRALPDGESLLLMLARDRALRERVMADLEALGSRMDAR
jgi:hypothetical protein